MAQLGSGSRHLRCAADWQDGEGLNELVQATRGLVLGKAVGLPGRAWRDGAVLTTDVLAPLTDHPRAREAAKCGIQASVVIPLRSSGVTIGILEFFAVDELELDDDARLALRAVGDLIGQHLRRQEAERRMDETSRVLGRLASMSHSSLAMLREGTLRNEICAACRDISESDIVLLWEPDETQRHLRVTSCVGFDGTGLTVSLDNERSGAASAFASTRSIFVADIASHALPSPRLARTLGAVSALYLPVTFDGRSVATMSLAWKRPTEPPTEPVRVALTVLADQLAIAMEIAIPILAREQPGPYFVATTDRRQPQATGGLQPGRGLPPPTSDPPADGPGQSTVFLERQV